MKEKEKTKMKRIKNGYLSFIPIPTLIVIVVALSLIDKPSLFYEPSWLLPITNTVFVTVVFLIVAYIAMRNYKATGRIQILLLGCGVLAFGIGGAVAGFVRSVPGAGANLNVTIYNTGALIGAVFHLAAAFLLLAGISAEVGSERKEFWLVFSYGGLAAFMALFVIASLKGIIPAFFIQGVGPTALRQWVLGAADILFAFSFLIFMGLYFKNREVFLYWYSTALVLTAISLTAFFIQSAVGSPIGWAGRFAQYLGGIYFLIAVMTAIRSAHARRISFNNVITASLSPAEETFRALAENSPDIICRYDREMRHIYLNAAGLRLYRKSADSVIGKTLEETGFPETHCSLWRGRIEKVFETSQPMEVEDYLPNETGTGFYHSHCVPEYGVDGTVANVLVVSNDLTERKRVEKEREGLVVRLEEAVTEANRNRAQLEAVFQAMQDGLVVFDMDQNAVLVNEAESRIHGFASAEEMKQDIANFAKLYELFDPSGQPLPVEDRPISRVLRGESLDRLELRGRRRDTGQERFFSFSGAPVSNVQGKQVLAITVTHDITKSKQAEKALRESENAYRALAQNLPGMVYRVFIRENNRMEFFNKMLQPMTGYRVEELSAGEVCSIDSIVLSEDRETMVAAVKRAIKDHQPFEVEYRLRNKGGETRYLLERGRPIYGEDGDPLYIDGIILDISARKVTEEALRQLDHEKAVVLNATVEGMGLVDKSLRMVWANRVVGDRAGLSLEQLPGRYCFEIWAGRSNPCVGCPILKTIETGRSEEAEIPSSDGKIWLHRGYPVINASGRVDSVVATAIDITERKRAEEALLFKENIVKHSSSVIATCDLEGNMTYGNPSFLRTWGFDNSEEFLGRSFWEFWLVEDRRDEIMRVLRDKGRWFGEIRAMRKDGSIFDVQVSSATVFDSGGNPVALTSTSTDITERKQTQEKLRQHAQILDQIHDAVISTDLDGYVVTWNKGAERIFGYLAEEASGKHISLIYPPDQHEFLQYKVIEPLKKKARHENEVKVRRKSGEDFYAYLSLSMLKNEEGLEIGMIGNSIDLTERRQMEEELRRSREELEIRVRERTAELAKANKALRHLSSKLLSAQEDERKGIAGELHDTIGSCLTGLKFKVENALLHIGESSPIATESLKTIIPIIQEGVQECRRIQTDLRPSILDDLGLLATLSWFCRRYQTIYTRIKVELEQTLEERGIPDYLKVVIFRVTQEGMNNIAKHSKADLVHLSLRNMEERIEFVLEDNGEGFDLKRALGSRNTRRGLGLTSMRERVELSGGSFAIESTKGKGTIIRASWPLSEKPQFCREQS
jgi:PAS domain S-box-containing protein